MLVAVLNNKGGVGKSTIAVHAAVWLQERGVKLAVLDADAQSSTSEWLSRAAPGIRIECCNTVAQINERLPRVATVYDVVIVDGPAALSAETIVLAAAADLVLLPIGPSLMDVRASYRTARLLYNVRLRIRHDGRPEVVTILNRMQPRTRLAQIAQEAVHRYGFPVARTALALRQAYAEACGRDTVVWRMGAAGRGATAEIDRLFDELFASLLARPADARPAVASPAPRSLPVSALLTPGAPASPIYPTLSEPVVRNAVCPHNMK
jgi:chromosome partitioning protein